MTEKLVRKPFKKEVRVEYRKITSPKRWSDWNKEPKQVDLEEAIATAKKGKVNE